MTPFLTEIGEITRVYTSVDFYTYIKGMEYLICVAFFSIFPLFYRYIHKEE